MASLYCLEYWWFLALRYTLNHSTFIDAGSFGNSSGLTSRLFNASIATNDSFDALNRNQKVKTKPMSIKAL